ncbi:MAG: DUF4143 domain-containing protein [Armatimonadota bacterium]|nr:DUF4143 domain-containing protein [Armatimonadota bacterium]MDR7427650.1 DUF4143 domain-containing protein [Armatimonadota bacterium]MDR7464293.1 DUF4143 domain-containing protein [Armatimonadota bacterium]MDR7470169.1 DUF4143 domain-containing protein [Armatimonadota bacterium]MDR7538882.1 DUF4143 domain-containing protein [Armatimonadota bacterium]
MEVLTLWPLSQGEIDGVVEDFIDRAFASTFSLRATVVPREEVARRIACGGFPQVVLRASSRRPAWFRSYLTTISQRTVRDLAAIERLHEVPRLLSALAGRMGALLNAADLSRTLGIPLTTLQRYLALLQTAFLLYLLPAWTPGVRRRLLKSPKILLVDTGLAAHLVGLDSRGMLANVELWGAFVEAFVVVELLKQTGWSATRCSLYHFRTARGEEVDVVLEAPDGRVVGVEIKAAVSIDAGDFRGLRVLAQAAGRRFLRGILLYFGEEAVPFGDNLYALPISGLWQVPQPRVIGRSGRAARRGQSAT